MNNQGFAETKGSEQTSPVRVRLAQRDPVPRPSEDEVHQRLEAANTRRNAYLAKLAERAKRHNKMITSTVATHKFIHGKDSQLRAAQLASRMSNAEQRRSKVPTESSRMIDIWKDEDSQSGKKGSQKQEFIPKWDTYEVSPLPR